MEEEEEAIGLYIPSLCRRRLFDPCAIRAEGLARFIYFPTRCKENELFFSLFLVVYFIVFCAIVFVGLCLLGSNRPDFRGRTRSELLLLFVYFSVESLMVSGTLHDTCEMLGRGRINRHFSHFALGAVRGSSVFFIPRRRQQQPVSGTTRNYLQLIGKQWEYK